MSSQDSAETSLYQCRLWMSAPGRWSGVLVDPTLSLGTVGPMGTIGGGCHEVSLVTGALCGAGAGGRCGASYLAVSWSPSLLMASRTPGLAASLSLELPLVVLGEETALGQRDPRRTMPYHATTGLPCPHPRPVMEEVRTTLTGPGCHMG